MSVYYAFYPDGQRSSMSDSSGISSYTYDSLGRLTKLVNGANQEVDYGYDAASRRNKLTYPGGANVVNRTYYDNGQLKTVQSWLDTQANTFYYNADSSLCLTTYANGSVGTRAYDRADRLTGILYANGGATACGQTPTGTTLLNLSYSRDSVGQLSADSGTSYAYDQSERLCSNGGSSCATGSTYGLNVADQLTSVPLPGGTTLSPSYDTAGQLTTASISAGGSDTFTYDAAGNRVSTAGPNGLSLNYTYDQLNRLTSFGSTRTGTWFPSRTFGYAYNGDGLRTSKSVEGVTDNTYTWDVAEGLPLLLGDGAASYVTGPGGLPLEQIAAGNAYYYLGDQLGSTRLLLDSLKTVQDSYAYDPYGNLVSSSINLVNPFTFAGQYQDLESGLVYLRARYYDPSIGQFISRDPLSTFTRSPYAYTTDNPVNARDLTGLYNAPTIGQVNQHCDAGEGASCGDWINWVKSLYGGPLSWLFSIASASAENQSYALSQPYDYGQLLAGELQLLIDQYGQALPNAAPMGTMGADAGPRSAANIANDSANLLGSGWPVQQSPDQSDYPVVGVAPPHSILLIGLYVNCTPAYLAGGGRLAVS